MGTCRCSLRFLFRQLFGRVRSTVEEAPVHPHSVWSGEVTLDQRLQNTPVREEEGRGGGGGGGGGREKVRDEH